MATDKIKIAIISFGLCDINITLAKYLSKYIKVDLYIVMNQNMKKHSIMNFDNVKTEDGFLPEEILDKSIDGKVRRYISGAFKHRVFLYPGSGFKKPANIISFYKFSKFLKEKKYNGIHFSGNDISQFFISVFMWNVPKIHTIHDYIGHEGERKFIAELLNKYLVITKRQKIFHSGFCLTQINAALLKMRKASINHIPFGCLEVYRMWKDPLTQEDRNKILFFGRIAPYKGIKYLIMAILIIKKEFPDLKVTLAGECWSNFDINGLKNDSTYTIIKRYIPEEIVKLIQESSLVVCSHTDATQSAVIMTAYAFNKPIVATRVGGIPEVVDDGITGVLVPPRDHKSLAKSIIYLLKNPEKRKMMTENIEKKNSEGEFNWDHIAKRTVKVYEKAIKVK